MKQFEKILVAVDFSAYSKAAAKHALDLARELDSRVTFVHVINQRDIALIQHTLKRVLEESEAEITADDYVKTYKNTQLDKLETMIDTLNTNEVNTQCETLCGIPYQELLKAIKSFEADLLVMGTKGQTDPRDSQTGSTAIKMFSRCPIPLITVRETDFKKL